MKFELNKKEEETLQSIVESLNIEYDIDELRRIYEFIPTGLGNACKVTLIGYKGTGNKKEKVFWVKKDITDVDSW